MILWHTGVSAQVGKWLTMFYFVSVSFSGHFILGAILKNSAYDIQPSCYQPRSLEEVVVVLLPSSSGFSLIESLRGLGKPTILVDGCQVLGHIVVELGKRHG